MRRRLRRSERGQALVEFAIILPTFILVLFGMLEFGLVFDHHLTLEYATREGARTGSALADGGGDATICNGIDAQIVAAVQRVLAAPGSPVDVSRVSQISIWRATAQGVPDVAVGVFTWTYTGPNTGPLVDGQRLSFSAPNPLPASWRPCARTAGGSTPDSIGVSLQYSYKTSTPIMTILGAQVPMTDKTVMSLNPN